MLSNIHLTLTGKSPQTAQTHRTGHSERHFTIAHQQICRSFPHNWRSKLQPGSQNPWKAVEDTSQTEDQAQFLQYFQHKPLENSRLCWLQRLPGRQLLCEAATEAVPAGSGWFQPLSRPRMGKTSPSSEENPPFFKRINTYCLTLW